MTKKDYREKIEEHRQEIELDDTPSRMSRSNKNQINNKSKLLRNLTIAFILIPALVLIYVTFFYEPKLQESNEVDQPPIEVQTNKPSNNNSAANENENDTEDEKAKEEAALKEKEAAEAAAKAEADKKAKEEADKLAQQKAQEEEQKKREEQQAASSTTYTVKPGDTLYSISRAHYNGEIRVQGIIQANNLSTESITVGQVLVIPK